MKLLGFQLFFVLFSTGMAKTYDSNYVVTAPRMMWAGQPYKVHVLLMNVQMPTTVTVQLLTTAKGSTVSSQGLSFSTSGEVKVASLMPPKNPTTRYTQYYLEISFQNGATLIRNSTMVAVSYADASLMIQTDKGLYKAGQTVRIRALLINKDFKPLQDKVTIKIKNPDDIILGMYKNLTLNTGVVSVDFELSDEPQYGDWKIEAQMSNNDDVSGFVEFEVDQYVLPRFEVTIDAPPMILNENNDQSQQFKVTGKYTYGEFVEGLASCILSTDDPNYMNRVKKIINLQKDLVNGQATFELSESYYMNVANSISVNCSVMEAGSKVRLYDDVKIRIVRSSVNVSIMGEDSFIPGLPYDLCVKVWNIYGRPIPDGYKVTFVVVGDLQHKIDKSVVSLDQFKNGLYCVQITMENKQMDLMVELRYADSGTANQYLKATAKKIIRPYAAFDEDAPSNGFNMIPWDISTKSPLQTDHVTIAGDDIYFRVYVSDTSQATSSELYYQVFAKGSMTLSDQIEYPSSYVLLKIKTTTEMVPESVIFMYMVSNKTLVADWAKFKVAGNLSNQVSASFNKDRAKVKEDVQLTVKASSGSFFGVAAIDKGSLLLKDPNSFTMEKLFSVLGDFDLTTKPTEDYLRMVYTSQILKAAGVVYMTNAFVKTYVQDRWLEDAVFFDGVDIMFKSSDNTGSSAPISADTVRKNFPETWLWLNGSISSGQSATITAKVPDSITSWYTQVFAIDPVTGLGIAPNTEIQAFIEMFIAIEVPPVAIRNEIFDVKVLVFQYLDNQPTEVPIQVSLKGSKQYNVIDNSSNPNGDKTFNLLVQYGKPKVVFLSITPTVIGEIQMSLEAVVQSNSQIQDSILKTFTVVPEGNRKELSQSVFLEGSEASEGEIFLNFPSNTVPDSRKVIVTLVGDSMGQALNNPEKLVTVPTGCGEQNMASTVPNIFVKKYLDSIDQSVQALEEKINSHIRKGYQRELNYRRDDGSFSAFGMSDESGSTWLTSFVIKSFSQANSVLPDLVDFDVIEKALRWVLTQTISGTANEPGRVIHTEYQGGTVGNKYKLTIYVVSCLAEMKKYFSAYLSSSVLQQLNTQNEIFCKNMKRWYENKEIDTEDPYTLALLGYSLAISCNSPLVDQIYQKLLEKAKDVTTEGSSMQMLCWECDVSTAEPDDGSEKPVPLFKSMRPPAPTGKAIEISGYVLMMKLAQLQGSPSFLDPIIRWLNTKRNGLGGFSSTQDTVVALQALAEFSIAMNKYDAAGAYLDATVNYTVAGGSVRQHKFNRVDSQSRTLQQRFELPSNTVSVRIIPSGNSKAVSTVIWRYNVEENFVNKKMKLRVTNYYIDEYTQTVQSCVSSDGENNGMGLVTVALPTYFSAELNNNDNPYVRRMEQTNNDVNIYVDEIPKDEICMNVNIKRSMKIEKSKPVPVTAMLYYEPDTMTAVLYDPSEKKFPQCKNNVCSGTGKLAPYSSLPFISMIILVVVLRSQI